MQHVRVARYKLTKGTPEEVAQLAQGECLRASSNTQGSLVTP